MDEPRATGEADEPREAEAGALLLVDVRELRVADRGEEPEPEPGGTPRRRRGGSPDEHERLRAGLGRHPDRPPAPLEGLARPRPPEHVDVLLEEPAARFPVDTGHGELLVPVPEPRDEPDARAAGEVQHRELLGQPHRVVEGDQ